MHSKTKYNSIMARVNENDKDVLGYVGKRFDMRAIMAKYNVSISDLANSTGMSYNSVQSLIRLNRPSTTNLYKVAMALGCDVTDLFFSAKEIANPSIIETTASMDRQTDFTLDDEVPHGEERIDVEEENSHNPLTCPYCGKRFVLID